ncbi:Dyp-type peroxidase [Jiangella asiatica]|uniref:Dyp-type peroxidase n=1 Tax=Jiangella asiatica TaxID=2530372 RepID=A0A4R5DQR6_9ACTN|nr:Dyp-type peroxidase [Jiangella asiatica]
MTAIPPEDRAQDVLAPPAMAAIFLTLTVRPGGEDAVREALSGLAGLTRAIGFRVPEAQLSCVVGVGARLWDRMYDAPRPVRLHTFEPVVGAQHTAVSTPGDLLFHVRATRQDLCFELCYQVMRGLDGSVDAVDEVHGFRYWDERDLLGFVDGTESPTSRVAAAAAGFVGDEDPYYVGGSYVIVQKYLHDLAAWDKLSVEEQELAVGRRKLSDIELPDGVKPPNSHVAATTIVDPDGTERQILRHNMPFGNVAAGEFGTYFIGYAADPAVIEHMLQRMFIGEPPGNTDRILDFSTAVTGSLFFVPPADFLEDPDTVVAAASSRGLATANNDTMPSDGSLGIGSLRRSNGS